MKIKKIQVKNFKAISDKEIEFNGCSAIVTAGNNKGKTTLLRGLVDRFRSEKPDIVVKQGEEKGLSSIELTDGSVIEWKFTEKSESFSFTTKDGIKQTTGVLSGIGEKYFGKKFDIDKFLSSSPKSQIKELQDLVGLDFSKIDERYKKAYEDRTEANRELKRMRSMEYYKPEKVEKPDIESLNKELKKEREENRKKEETKTHIFELETLKQNLNESPFKECFDFKKAEEIISKMPDPKTIVDTDEIEEKIRKSNEQLRQFDSYERDLDQYEKWIKDGKKAKEEYEKCDKKVKKIEEEKKEMIANADVPNDFEITEDGILYKGLPLTDSQISSSGKYIAALKLGAMVLGEVKSLHFDASFLDKNSLSEIQEWANKNDLQLLIERPDFEGGEIKYEVL